MRKYPKKSVVDRAKENAHVLKNFNGSMVKNLAKDPASRRPADMPKVVGGLLFVRASVA